MFDSGFGGLTVARAFIDLMPGEHLVYVGDTGRYPYGPRPLEQVRLFARQIAWWLVRRQAVKLEVVACNTASAAALDVLASELPVPVVGVIAPGVRAMARATVSGRVGVIGTVGTIGSGAYQRAVAELAGHLELHCAACPGFVEFVERGETSSEQVTVLAERLLDPLKSARIDTLLLGCTHYPFLARTIGEVMGRDVVLVSSADETAFEVRELLLQGGLARPAISGRLATRVFYSTGNVQWFREVGSRLFGEPIDDVRELPLAELEAATSDRWGDAPHNSSVHASVPAASVPEGTSPVARQAGARRGLGAAWVTLGGGGC
jgi:glutamate racemase